MVGRGTMKMKGKYGEIVRSDRTFDVIAAVLGCIIIVIVMVPLIFVVAASQRSAEP